MPNEKCAFIVEIGAKENRKLVDHMQGIFIIKVLKRTPADKKRGRHTEAGNLFLKIKVTVTIVFVNRYSSSKLMYSVSTQLQEPCNLKK